MDNKSSQSSKPKRTRRPPGYVELIKTRERHRTARYLIVCALIAFCVWNLTQAAVELLQRPPWVTVVTALVSAIVAILVPTPIFQRFFVRIRRFTATTTARLATLEQSVDEERTSSGQRQDGTDPPEPDFPTDSEIAGEESDQNRRSDEF